MSAVTVVAVAASCAPPALPNMPPNQTVQSLSDFDSLVLDNTPPTTCFLYSCWPPVRFYSRNRRCTWSNPHVAHTTAFRSVEFLWCLGVYDCCRSSATCPSWDRCKKGKLMGALRDWKTLLPHDYRSLAFESRCGGLLLKCTLNESQISNVATCEHR